MKVLDWENWGSPKERNIIQVEHRNMNYRNNELGRMEINRLVKMFLRGTKQSKAHVPLKSVSAHQRELTPVRKVLSLRK